MGEIVLAAKVTHVPTMYASEQDGPLKGCRAQAIDSHRRMGELARAAGADTFVVFDTHWLVNAGYHVNANAVFKGRRKRLEGGAARERFVIPPALANVLVDGGIFKISSTFNELVDRMVLDMWVEGRIAEFLEMLPDHARHCSGEGGMHDTAMLFGALGWDRYTGRGQLLCDYFPSSGTGQVNVMFTLPESGACVARVSAASG